MFPEPERDPVKQVLLIGIFFWIAVFFLFALLNGCISAPVAPGLKLPEAPAKECPRLVMPPIPEDVELDIKGDKINKINGGGDVLLRGYSRARQLLQ